MKREAIEVMVGAMIPLVFLAFGTAWFLAERASGTFVGLFGGFSYPL